MYKLQALNCTVFLVLFLVGRYSVYGI